MLLGGRLGAPEGGDGGRDLGGDRGVLPGRRLGLMLQLETLLQMLLADMLLQLQVVLKMQLLQRRRRLHWRARLGGGGRAHHGAHQRSPKVRRHAGGDADRRDHRVHGESHGQGFGSNGPRERRLEGLSGGRGGSVLRQRRAEKEGGGQVGGRQGLLNGANGLGFCWFGGSLRLRGDRLECFYKDREWMPKMASITLASWAQALCGGTRQLLPEVESNSPHSESELAWRLCSGQQKVMEMRLQRLSVSLRTYH